MPVFYLFFALLALPPPEPIEFPSPSGRASKGQLIEQPDRPGEAEVWRAIS